MKTIPKKKAKQVMTYTQREFQKLGMDLEVNELYGKMPGDGTTVG